VDGRCDRRRRDWLSSEEPVEFGFKFEVEVGDGAEAGRRNGWRTDGYPSKGKDL